MAPIYLEHQPTGWCVTAKDEPTPAGLGWGLDRIRSGTEHRSTALADRLPASL